MISLYRYGKHYALKKLSTGSIASLPFLHENVFASSQTLSICYKNQLFMHFCSIVDMGSTTGISAPKRKPNFSKNLGKDKSYTISYLINSCGLSPEEAISVSEKVDFRTAERPDFVLALLKKQGFSSTHIATLVRKRPELLLFDPEKILAPKLEFFKSLGVKEDDLGSIISRDPGLLAMSLNNSLIPYYNYLKSVLLTDENMCAALRRQAWVFKHNYTKNLAPNITVLKELNVPPSLIKMLLIHFFEVLEQKNDEFRASVAKVLEMGFNPLRSAFVLALHALSGKSNKAIWARCYETYIKLGWSKDDIYMAFKKHPQCMIMSEEKICKTMDLLVNKMGFESKMIVSRPMLLNFSLEKRIIPRCSTLQFLISRNLINKEDVPLSSLLSVNEERFLKRFVTKYEKQVPNLYDFYKGKIGIEEL